MNKIVTGRRAAGAIDLTTPPSADVRNVARALGTRPTEVSTYLLDRDRHADVVADLRSAGARVCTWRAGDTAPAIAAAGIGGGKVDLVLGVGGSPEAVIVTAAMRCLGGEIQARLWPRDEDEERRIGDAGHDPSRGAHHRRAGRRRRRVRRRHGQHPFGHLLDGDWEDGDCVVTESLVMRSHPSTWRRIGANHSHSPDKHALLIRDRSR